MEQLICKTCGSTELQEQDGFLVCQICGAKFAKQDLVKNESVDNGAFNFDNVLKNARMAFEQENWDDVQKYYTQIKENDPENLEAVLFSAYAPVAQKLVNINVFDKVLEYIVKKYSAEKDEEFYNLLSKVLNDFSKTLDYVTGSCNMYSRIHDAKALANVFVKALETIIDILNENKELKLKYLKIQFDIVVYSKNLAEIKEYLSKIKELDESFVLSPRNILGLYRNAASEFLLALRDLYLPIKKSTYATFKDHVLAIIEYYTPHNSKEMRDVVNSIKSQMGMLATYDFMAMHYQDNPTIYAIQRNVRTDFAVMVDSMANKHPAEDKDMLLFYFEMAKEQYEISSTKAPFGDKMKIFSIISDISNSIKQINNGTYKLEPKTNGAVSSVPTPAFIKWLDELSIKLFGSNKDELDHSRLFYAFIAAFFGIFGIHNFYTGYTKAGVIKIILTIIPAGFIISWAWAFVDIFITTKRKDGTDMKWIFEVPKEDK